MIRVSVVGFIRSRQITATFPPAAWAHAALPVKNGSEVVITNGAKATQLLIVGT